MRFIVVGGSESVRKSLSRELSSVLTGACAIQEAESLAEARELGLAHGEASCVVVARPSEAAPTDAALSASEDRLARAQQAARVGTWDWDVQADRAYWTDEARQLFGLDVGSQPITLALWLGTVHPMDRAAALEANQRGLRDGSYTHEYRVVHPDGTELTLEAVGRAYFDADGRPVRMLGTVRDVSERRRFESELLRRERALQSLADNSPDVMARFDRLLRHVFVNAAATRATGLARDELLGKSNRELGMPEHLCVFWEDALRSVFETGARRTLDFATTQDGQTRHYVSRLVPEHGDDGTVEHVLCVAEDVTERVLAERALRQNEERLRLAFEAARMGWWDYDVQRDHVLWSADLEKKYEPLPASSGVGLGSVLARVHPSDRLRLQTAIDDALSRRGSFKVELRWLRADDAVRWRLSTGQVYCDAGGRPERIVTVELDITERKQLEQRLLEADHRKDQFIATLAHELRGPLAPLRTGLELLDMEHDDLEAAGRTRRMMERQLGQMVRLVDDLLDASRINSGKVELVRRQVDLCSVIEDAIDTTRPLIEAASQSLSYERPETPVVVSGDAGRLTQVFANILNNASKYTPRQGNIMVTLRSEAGEAVVRVADNGAGIPREQQAQVFELFSQSRSTLLQSQGGLGIGLALVRRLVELHGGSVHVHSEGPGRGSAFTVRLAVLATAVEQAPDDVAAPRVVREASGLRVLVVDDNDDTCALLAMMLTAMGHQVQTAQDAAQALSLAAQWVPDLVLCDIGLPEVDGYEVCRRLRALPGLSRTVIAALTGWAAESDRLRSEEAGFHHHLAKPVDRDALRRLLATCQATA